MTRAHMMVRSGFVSKKFLMFLLTGGFAAAVNWGSRIVYSLWLPYSAAIVVAFFTGLITGFILVKLFVFKETRHSTARSAFYFTLVNLIAIVQTWAVSMALAFYVLPRLGITWHVKEIAHLVGVCVPVFTSYVGHKHITFRG